MTNQNTFNPITPKEFKNLLKSRVLIYDGAMGTNLIKQGLASKSYGGYEPCSEALNLFAPEAVKKVHKGFIAAGCEVIETNTFGASALTLKEYGLESRVEEINLKAAELAKESIKEAANGKRVLIAGSMGPGSLLPSLGHISFDELANSYKEQMTALMKAEIDIFQIETCQDLLQIKAALYAAEDVFNSFNRYCPVVVSVTLEPNGTMLVGSDLQAVAAALEPYDFAEVLGINCATGPLEMTRHVECLSKAWPRSILVMPNAGLPENIDGKPFYRMAPNEFANHLEKFVKELGVNIVGGCCGTSFEHMAEVVKRLSEHKPTQRILSKNCESGMVSSLFNAVSLKQNPAPALIGERTNANGAKKFREHLLNNDFAGMVAMGKAQAKGGAHLVDLCMAYVGRNEAEDFSKLVPMFASQVSLPLVIDSTSPQAIEAALKRHGGRCVINSVNLEDGGKRLREIAKLARRFGAALICLAIDEEGMAKTAEKKLSIALRMLKLLKEEFGFKDSDLIFDNLTFTVASGEAEQRNAASETLKAISLLKEKAPNVNTILGVSNVSFGLSASLREILNSVFLAEATKLGLTSAIVNPAKIIPIISIGKKEKELALNLIYNKHGDGSDLTEFMAISADTKQKKQTDISSLPPSERLFAKVVDGDLSELSPLLELLRSAMAPNAIINEILLSAMKKVGDYFAEGALQLPFVLQSAEVVKQSVSLLEPFMKRVSSSPDKKVILATVAGDVHDIGKNLVNIMLSNNGFEVIDLGVKVDIASMIKAAKQHGAHVIAMSGLLVRSTQIMKENLEELNRQGFLPVVILGGAALTKDFVENELKPMYKGQVFYAKTALDDVAILNSLSLDKAKNSIGQNEPKEQQGQKGQEAQQAQKAQQAQEAQQAQKAQQAQEAQKAQKARNEHNEHKEPEEPKAQKAQNEQFTVVVEGKSPLKGSEADLAQAPTTNRHQYLQLHKPVRPQFFGVKQINIDSSELFRLLSHRVLFEARWGYKRGNKSEAEQQETLEREAKPALNYFIELQDKIKYINAKAMYGFFKCKAENDTLRVFDDMGICVAEFKMPRQSKPPFLCLTDFIAENDVCAFFASTIGSAILEQEKAFQDKNEYLKYHQLHGLGAEMADCAAVYTHKILSSSLLPKRPITDKTLLGRRYSFGYPACPNLEYQKDLLRFVKAEQIGLKLTEGFQMQPELSVSGFVIFNKNARYFVP